MTYGVVERKGFILLTGEVGTGKTTMVHALLENLSKDVQYVYLSNPLFTPKDFMDYLAFSVFKKKVHFKTKADFLIQFEAFLKDRLQHQKNFILIIDEAQKLSFELLEEVRLLSNMETAEEKLINIFLVGQPELNNTLNQHRCRPLLQRISIRYHIKPLNIEGVQEYITTRLRLAGSEKDNNIIPLKTIKAIHKYSEGYPRMINVLTDNALLHGYSREKKRITPQIVKECFEDMQLDGSFFEQPERNKELEKKEEKKPKQIRARWLWVSSIFIFLLIVSGLILTSHGKAVVVQMLSLIPLEYRVKNEDILKENKTSGEVFFGSGKKRSKRIIEINFNTSRNSRNIKSVFLCQCFQTFCHSGIFT